MASSVNQVDPQDEMDVEGWIEQQTENENDESCLKNKKARTTTRKIRSAVWDHFTKIQGSDPLKARCHYFPSEIQCDPIANGTSYMKSHMTRCKFHPHRLQEAEGTKQTTLVFKSNDGGLASTIFSQEACREAVAHMIILDELPFRVVSGEGFLKFCSVACPRFVVPHRTTIAKDCLAIYMKEKKKLKGVLKEQRIYITTDTWTSIQNINYMVVTAHYVDKGWTLNKNIISFCVIPDHRGVTIGRMVKKCLLSWGIDCLLTVTCDNASSNNLAIEWIKDKTKHWKNVVLEHEFVHVRCSAHILNLIVKDGLMHFDESICRIRDAVRYVRSSPARWSTWKKCVSEEKLDDEKNVCLDVATRWNSTYLMLEAAVKLENVFKRLEACDDLYNAYFSNFNEDGGGNDEDEIGEDELVEKKRTKVAPKREDFARARLFVQFLEVYYRTTTKISGSKYVTSDLLFNELIIVKTNLFQLCSSLDDTLCEIGERMTTKFDKYWSLQKINPLLCVAVILDPRFKMGYVEFSMKDLYKKPEIKALKEKVKRALDRLYEWYAQNCPSVTSSSSSSPSMNDSSMARVVEVDPISQWKKHNQRGSLGSMSEVDKYLSSPIEESEDKTFQILSWWKINATKYPILSLVARDVLAIPVTSVASESAFSTGGRILDPFRSSLRPNTVEALICAQSWLRSSGKPINLEATMEEISQYDEIDAELFEGAAAALSLDTTVD